VLQEITQKKSKPIGNSVACGVLVRLLKKRGRGCRKEIADPANLVLSNPGSESSTSRESGRETAWAGLFSARDRRGHGLGPKLILEGGSTVNAAFLLVTSAWLAGQAAPPPPAQPAYPPAHAHPAPAAPTASSACCDTGCDSCCEGGLLARLRGWFRRRDDCCDTCGGHPQPAPSYHDHGCQDECGCRPGLLDRLRGWFHRGDCCDGGAADCCATAAAPSAHVMPRPPEQIQAPKSTEPPKEMPKGTTNGAGIIMPQPGLAPASTLILDR
jgi:hypothetical protein